MVVKKWGSRDWVSHNCCLELSRSAAGCRYHQKRVEFHAAEVVSKVLPVLELVDDVEASAAWAHEKRERKTSWLELRAVCRFLDNLMTGNWLSRMRLPEELYGVKVGWPGKLVEVSGQGMCAQLPNGRVKPIVPVKWWTAALSMSRTYRFAWSRMIYLWRTRGGFPTTAGIRLEIERRACVPDQSGRV